MRQGKASAGGQPVVAHAPSTASIRAALWSNGARREPYVDCLLNCSINCAAIECVQNKGRIAAALLTHAMMLQLRLRLPLPPAPSGHAGQAEAE